MFYTRALCHELYSQNYLLVMTSSHNVIGWNFESGSLDNHLWNKFRIGTKSVKLPYHKQEQTNEYGKKQSNYNKKLSETFVRTDSLWAFTQLKFLLCYGGIYRQYIYVNNYRQDTQNRKINDDWNKLLQTRKT